MLRIRIYLDCRRGEKFFAPCIYNGATENRAEEISTKSRRRFLLTLITKPSMAG
uniref:Uncharacterized protein n=1 Tax=Candidatus Kentrum sp. DK TaxID=2126562 RepID=A0A450S753_9GAMM|nr:MAG: hypothetical protein BECKDK2373C_GA0170839_100615 [Candidatus Kentron sp. DK]VFJ47709.1 MAG: hypothetical protein BECKDK2373B_GA0170837_101822 [Candidatus Kentron sp. DK]